MPNSSPTHPIPAEELKHDYPARVFPPHEYRPPSTSYLERAAAAVKTLRLIVYAGMTGFLLDLRHQPGDERAHGEHEPHGQHSRSDPALDAQQRRKRGSGRECHEFVHALEPGGYFAPPASPPALQ